MGSWGSDPWDNDSAADWFSDLFRRGKISETVRRALDQDPVEYYEEIRAAAYVLQALGHTYIWPVDELVPLLEKAVARLAEVRRLRELEEGQATLQKIAEEIEILTRRLKRLS